MSDKQFAIEMDEGRGYGVVHAQGCRDLRDPESVGSDWKTGVSELGSDWEANIEDGAVSLAPCAIKLERQP